MTEDEVVQILHEYFKSLFPKVCPTCNRRFSTLLEYIQLTKRIGQPVSYDAEVNDWNTTRPIGSAALANCPCGSTLSLTTEEMPPPLRLEFLAWLRMETRRRGLSPSELLECLRDEVRRRVLDDSMQDAS